MLETLHYEYIDYWPKLGRRHGDGADIVYLSAATNTLVAPLMC